MYDGEEKDGKRDNTESVGNQDLSTLSSWAVSHFREGVFRKHISILFNFGLLLLDI